MAVDLLKAVQKDSADINNAAGEFLERLTRTNIKKDITLAAELAGLKLLRETKVDLSSIEPGTTLLGAVSDEAQDRIQRFIAGLAISNGLDVANNFGIPEDAKEYLPEVTYYETPLDEICKQHQTREEYYAFVAATAAMKLVNAGEKTIGLDPTLGFCIVSYHIIAGSKTVPYQAKDSS